MARARAPARAQEPAVALEPAQDQAQPVQRPAVA
jgi:hypothetical protein